MAFVNISLISYIDLRFLLMLSLNLAGMILARMTLNVAAAIADESGQMPRKALQSGIDIKS
jgi:hypothetical protein